MEDIIEKTDRILLRKTGKDDIAFVLEAEQEPENAQFVGQWTKEQHIAALENQDILHLIVEDVNSHRSVGYVIIAGVQNPNRNLEFRRIAIVDKGRGYGRETLRLIKKIAFGQFNAHRLWLDVRHHNHRAQHLYHSEGFVREGVLRECVFYNGHFESLIVMSILENEYKDRNHPSFVYSK